MSDSSLPYIGDGIELADAVVTLSNELLWRLTGYDERRPTPADVAEVVASLDSAKERFLARAAQQVGDGRHLQVVRSAG